MAELYLTSSNSSKAMVLDSGASHHIVNDPALIFYLRPVKLSVGTGNPNHALSALGIGSSRLKNHNGQEILLTNVLLIPEINRCLLSLPRILESLIILKKIGHSGFSATLPDEFEITGLLSNKLLEVQNFFFAKIPTPECNSVSTVSFPTCLWDLRLGHPSPLYLSKLFPSASSPD